MRNCAMVIRRLQVAVGGFVVVGASAVAIWALSEGEIVAVEPPVATAPAVDPANVPPAPNPDSEAASAEQMKKYKEPIPGTDVSFEMLPIPGGKYTMGSPDDEEGRKEDEGPQREVEIAPFWMGKCEVTWDEYDIWSFNLDIKRREAAGRKATDRDQISDAVARPTKPYTDMTFGKGHDNCPASCMTSLAAKTYCEWLSAKTGRYYRLPTEAEWEYAARAGTSTRFSWGDEAEKADEYCWNIDSSEERYHKVGTKKPNPWGLHDMHGNVMEWCLDQWAEDSYVRSGNVNPLIPAPKEYPQVVRGGGWDSTIEECRSAAREKSHPDWKIQDPQLPKSRWYHTDASFVGFRVVRPLSGKPPEKTADPK